MDRKSSMPPQSSVARSTQVDRRGRRDREAVRHASAPAFDHGSVWLAGSPVRRAPVSSKANPIGPVDAAHRSAWPTIVVGESTWWPQEPAGHELRLTCGTPRGCAQPSNQPEEIAARHAVRTDSLERRELRSAKTCAICGTGERHQFLTPNSLQGRHPKAGKRAPSQAGDLSTPRT
jgi:hypothetical protein